MQIWIIVIIAHVQPAGIWYEHFQRVPNIHVLYICSAYTIAIVKAAQVTTNKSNFSKMLAVDGHVQS